MSIIRVEVGDANFERAYKVLLSIPGASYKAAFAALKRAGETAKTRAGQYAAEEYTITKSEFMQNVSVHTKVAKYGTDIHMNIRFAGNVLPLIAFDTKYGRDGSVTARVKRNGGAKKLRNVFAARVSGWKGMYERVSGARLPIEQKYGPSAAQMMQNDLVVANMSKTILETYEKRIEHEITRMLEGY